MLDRLRIWVPRLAVTVAMLLLLLVQANAVRLLIQHNWSAITFPYPLDYGEGPLLDQAVRLAHFENIYRRDLTDPPYTIANYPPLFPLAQVPFVWLLGPAFWYGRALSTLSILGAAVFIGLTLHALTRDRLAAVIGGLTLLAFPYILHWSPLNRVDSLALGLSWAGLFVVARWPDRRRGPIVGAALLTAAIYTRQSYGLAAPLAAFVWLLYQSPRWRALEFAAMVGGASLALLVILNVLTSGGFFFNIVAANVNPFHWAEVERRAQEIVVHMLYLVIGSVVFLMVAIWVRIHSWWIVAPYLVGATISAVTVGKAGSNVNYLLELMAAFSLVAGTLIAWSGRRSWLRIPLMLLLAVQVWGLTNWTQEDYYHQFMGKVAQRTAIEFLAQFVQEADGPVLADEYMGLVPLARKELYFQPFEFKQLEHAGLWDEQPFVQAIEREEFSVILLYQPPDWDSRGERWTASQLDAISRSYWPGESLAYTVVYRPNRTRPVLLRPGLLSESLAYTVVYRPNR